MTQAHDDTLHLLESLALESALRPVYARDALQASERLFQTLADLVPAFIWTSTPGGQIQWRNHRWFTFSGQSGSSTFLDADNIHPDDRELAVERMKHACDQGSALRLEYRMRRFDGEYRWFLVAVQPVHDAAGAVTQWVGTAIEVHDQKDALEAERHARAAAENAHLQMQQLLAAIPTAIVVTSGPDHVYTLTNPAYDALIGYRSVIGRRVTDVFPYVADSDFIDVLRSVQETGETVTRQERRVMYERQQDGVFEEAYFTSFIAPLRNHEGRIVGVVTAGMEVTEQVRQRERVESLRQEAEVARAQLEQAHAQLESRIAERTAELARANVALASEIEVRRVAEAARSDLLRRLATAREEERRNTARDLHDQVGQTLSALMLAVKTACDVEPLPPAASSLLTDALRLAETLGREVHELAARLRPTVLDDIGLQAALRELVNDWTRRYHGTVDLQASWLERERLPADLETLLYRVVQEALTNVARHAKASHVSVVVERHDGHAITVVEDNGIGFDVSAAADRGRLGVVGMRERVELAGGSFEIESELNAGTTVIARVPVTLEAE